MALARNSLFKGWTDSPIKSAELNKNSTTIGGSRRAAAPHHIEIGGFILDSLGGVLFAEVYLTTNGDGDKDREELERLKEVFRAGTILRIMSNTFSFQRGGIRFYYPETEPLPEEECKELAPFFPREIRSGIMPEEAPVGSFYYAGSAFVEGKGPFLGNVSPQNPKGGPV